MGSCVYTCGSMSPKKVQQFSTGVQEYSTGSYAYNPGQMSGGKVPEYSTGFLCIYIRLYGRWEGPRVTFWVCMDISRALC